MRDDPPYFPTRAHLLVCTGPRCRERGATGLFRALWARMESLDLAYYRPGGSVRLTESGCLGACPYGPNAACYRRADGSTSLEEAWYAGLDGPRLLALAHALNGGDRLPAEGRFDRPPADPPVLGDDGEETG